MVAIAASGALPLVSPNGTGGVCLSQMVAMVVLGVLPPFHRMVHASYAYRERPWLRLDAFPPLITTTAIIMPTVRQQLAIGTNGRL